jgi:glucokinase
MKKWLLGIDVGGTKISVSLGRFSGRGLKTIVMSSRGGIWPKESLEDIKTAVEALLATSGVKKIQVLGAGLAIAGAVDAKRGVILKSPNLRKWVGVALRRKLTQKLGIAVFIENDANAAALGEKYFGLGKGIRDFLYVTVSTGIGSGIVSQGALLSGAAGSAGELGHMTVARNGLRCNCGKRGCLEAYGSGTAIGNHVREALKKGAQSRYLKKYRLNAITGAMVSAAAQKGDRVSIQARAKAADYLGIGLANVMNLLNPERIILGGGVMANPRLFWSPMMKAIRREAWPSAFKSCRVMKSRLRKRIGDLGAFAVVLENHVRSHRP